ncbi:MAG TPA: hypothetical protein VHL13_00180 [Pseudolabrys sp.]|jgi:hypothetical protein|nr:hypothetical protein [Pseudolabrys sp.]
MRILLTVAAAFAAGSLLSLVPAKAESPGYSDAGNPRSGASRSAPTFEDCYRLGWVRGVHVERFEFAAFDAECMAGRIPFDSGYAASSIRRGAK